jgi:hypothetical protein
MTTNTRLLQGSLRDFGLVEILQMMELGSTTGAIRLKQPNGRSGILYFQDGKMSNCSELDSGALTLGDVLQQSGMATSAQIEEAFAQQLSDPFGKRIGERLISMGVIHEGQLKEALRTKALWTARELSLWKDGSYEFITSTQGQNMMPYGEASFNLEVMRVTMEMVRYSDEWEQLQPYLPQGMRTLLQMEPTIPYALNLNARSLELLLSINLYRQVRHIASAIRRPELEVARDLAQLVQQRLAQVVFQETGPFPYAHQNGNGREVRLPDPAEKLRMESFELLNLISRMEQEWYKRRTPMEQLPALAEFINWTMDALAETCRARAVELDSNTLLSLLHREGLRYMGNYEFKIDQNHIDVDNFTSLCYEVLSSDIQKSVAFYEEASKVLQNILRRIFQTINARVASLEERLENQEVWETMLFEFTQYQVQQ